MLYSSALIQPMVYVSVLLYRKYKLPSTFVHKKRGKGKAPPKRILTYDRDICCLPHSFMRKDGTVPIPRSVKKRTFLCANGLVGKIRLSSEMSEKQIMSEIRSVFEKPFGYDNKFHFDILQTGGNAMKSLVVPSLSSSYTWTASTVAGNAKSKIYILAQDDLKVYV